MKTKQQIKDELTKRTKEAKPLQKVDAKLIYDEECISFMKQYNEDMTNQEKWAIEKYGKGDDKVDFYKGVFQKSSLKVLNQIAERIVAQRDWVSFLESI